MSARRGSLSDVWKNSSELCFGQKGVYLHRQSDLSSDPDANTQMVRQEVKLRQDNKLHLATPDATSEAAPCKKSGIRSVEMLASCRDWSHKVFKS